ncbi:MAG: class I SAM-dependent methyltransferase [Methanobacterium sp.]
MGRNLSELYKEEKYEAKEHEMKVDREDPSKMAEEIAFHRVVEMFMPEDEKIFSDPYAIRFVNPEMLENMAKNPVEAQKKSEELEKLFPGVHNSIIARVRYFDDFVEKLVDEDLEQLVILGAGYDTRAYRIEGLKENVKVFEVDHPNTQSFKIQKIREIFGSIPDHVIYVPVDFDTQKLDQRLLESGYGGSKKTLFIMEGLVMYIPPDAVDETLSFIVNNSGKGSAVIFDYVPQSVVDGTSDLEVGKNLHNHAKEYKEPLQFGIEEGTLETFLKNRGFSSIESVTSEDYQKAYFDGKKRNKDVCSLFLFASAVVE